MCGIAGVRRFGNDPITGEELLILLCRLEHRGMHATGIALSNPDGIHVLKAPVPAWRFTKSKEFEDFLNEFLTPETETALLHTRWATTGSPEENENNHPMYDGETAIVHNGMIGNHDSLFSANKAYKRSCETDSDVIRAILSEHGFNEKGIRELCKMSGSAAIACVSTKHPHKLLLARSGSPLVYGFSETGGKLYWASEAQAILHAARPFYLRRGVWVQDTRANISVASMPDNTAWLFGPEEMEFHHVFNVCYNYRQPDYTKGRDTYHARTKQWKKELKRKMKQAQKKEDDSKKLTENVINSIRRLPAETSYVARQQANDLVGAVISCPSCGTGNRNTTGKLWSALICSKCEASLG